MALPHKHWRVLFSAGISTSYIELAEIQFREVAGTPQVPSGGAPVASSERTTTTFGKQNAFDGNNATVWSCALNQTIGSWLGYTFATAKEFVECAITSSTATNVPPKDFEIQSSEDGIEWFFRGEGKSQTAWAANETRLYALAEPTVKPVRATQAPILVIDKPNQKVRATQVPILVIDKPSKGTLVTQAPILVVWQPPPVPKVVPRFMPEVPLTETWAWKTAVSVAENSNEQRAALRTEPRVRHSFTAIIGDNTEREQAIKSVVEYSGKTFQHPFYLYTTKLTKGSDAGTNKVYFTPSQTDMRAGEALALFDPSINQHVFATIQSVDADGATLSANLDVAVPDNWYVCPAPVVRFTDPVGLVSAAMYGTTELRLETIDSRAVRRAAGSFGLTTIDGMPVLDKRHLADEDIDELFYKDVSWLDNEIASPVPQTRWSVPLMEGKRQYLVHRPGGMDYWRAFADSVKGRQKPFLVPTFRDDLSRFSNPALGSSSFKTTNFEYYRLARRGAYQYLSIETANGTLLRKVNEALYSYDPSGKHESVIVNLASAFGTNPGDNIIKRVSFVYKCRLANDEISITHHEVDSVVDLDIVAVNA